MRELVFLLVDLVHGLLVQHRDNGLLGSEFLVEGTDIEDVLGQLWLVRRGQLPLQKFVDVNRLEPRVLQDFGDAALGTETVVRILLE